MVDREKSTVFKPTALSWIDKVYTSGVQKLGKRMSLENFSIIESTLREGEQFANAFFNADQKLEIARLLDALGVEYLELTSPAASPKLNGLSANQRLGATGQDFDPCALPHG
ncbi:MAG: hypothetical protein R2932_18350 [Caldilineaceae bacterium]